jgi:hypothetical protein
MMYYSSKIHDKQVNIYITEKKADKLYNIKSNDIDIDIDVIGDIATCWKLCCNITASLNYKYQNVNFKMENQS